MEGPPLGYYEFFCGGGMARLGLGPRWTCLFANDNHPAKAAAYRANFPPADELTVKNVEDLAAAGIPGEAALAWASFPCQDLSLAGGRGGLRARRSGAFWPFWDLMLQLGREGRAPKIAVLENVTGVITSNGGGDFQSLLEAVTGGGYNVGALVADAARFAPQSRPRFFLIAAHESIPVPADLRNEEPGPLWHPAALTAAHSRLPAGLQRRWLWWRLPCPPPRAMDLADIVEENPEDAPWHAAAETRRVLAMMSDANRRKLKSAMAAGRAVYGTLYKRTREGRQRAEARFDGTAGCLRTPAGGSSRQCLIRVEGRRVNTRLLSAREAARLMGVPDTYRLPENYNEAYHLMGDGLAVPVVAWIADHILAPLAAGARADAPQALAAR